MANEILVLEGQGAQQYDVCFLFPIGTPKQVNGQNVVPTPAPTEGPLSLLLTAQEKADLNGGVVAFSVVVFRKDPELPAPELIARLREMYARGKEAFDLWYAERYLHLGVRLNAVA